MNANPIVAETPDVVLQQHTYFDEKKFEDLITDKGYEAYIDRAIQCPCRVKASGQALSDCQNCGGVGWFYIDRQKTKIACIAMSNRNKYETWTTSNAGTVSISTRPVDKLGWMDRVSLIELESWFSQAIYLKQLQDNSYFTFLTYEPITVFDVFLFKGSAVPVAYLTPDKYAISGNKILVPLSTITDLNIDSSITEFSISIRYTHNPAYYIIDINRDLIKQTTVNDCGNPIPNKTNLPLNCIGKRAHFVLNAANFTNDNLFNNTPNRTPINYDY